MLLPTHDAKTAYRNDETGKRDDTENPYPWAWFLAYLNRVPGLNPTGTNTYPDNSLPVDKTAVRTETCC
jgi:hypothetical protein